VYEREVVIARSVHDVHVMNAYKYDHVRLSVSMIESDNRLTDLDENWHRRFATHSRLP
jgi:hypothetical protein